MGTVTSMMAVGTVVGVEKPFKVIGIGCSVALGFIKGGDIVQTYLNGKRP